MAQMNTNIIKEVNLLMNADLPANASAEIFRIQLAGYINELINRDFDKLIAILYRVDVNEAKLSQLLNENKGEHASLLIADMIIDRQLQKMASKNRMKRQDEQASDEEKW
jgi:hypothetical protein